MTFCIKLIIWYYTLVHYPPLFDSVATIGLNCNQCTFQIANTEFLKFHIVGDVHYIFTRISHGPRCIGFQLGFPFTEEPYIRLRSLR
jgi:hypothetical protein